MGYRGVLSLAIILLAVLVCSCGGSGILTAHGGWCSSFHCYGEGLGNSYDEAYDDAVNSLNSAILSKNRCNGQGPSVAKEQVSGGNYLVQVAMYNTVDCGEFALTPEEKAERRERQANLTHLVLASCLILNTVLFFVLKDEFGETAYQFVRKMAEEEGHGFWRGLPGTMFWWVIWMPLTRFGFFIGLLFLLAAIASVIF